MREEKETEKKVALDLWEELNPIWQVCLSNVWDFLCKHPDADVALTAAAVVDKEGQILSLATGHDLTGGRFQILDAEGQLLREHILAHAELNSLLRLDYKLPAARERKCILYATVEPCPLCIGALVMSNVICELRYASRDPWAGSVSLFDTTPYLVRQKTALTIYGPDENCDFEETLIAMQIAGWLGGRRRQFLIDAYAKMLPQAAKVAEELHKSNSLRLWRDRKVPIDKVVNSVQTFLQKQREHEVNYIT